MGPYGVILTLKETYDINCVYENIVGIIKKCGYYFVASGSEDCRKLYVSEFLASRDYQIIYILSGTDNKYLGFDDEENKYTDFVDFDNGDSKAMLIRILYEYFRIYNEDYFIVEEKKILDSKSVKTIYESNDWNTWIDNEFMLNNDKNSYIHYFKEKITYDLYRNGKWQLVLRKTEKFDGLKLKDQLTLLFSEKEYEYYEERYKTEWPEYYYDLLYLNTGTLSGSVKIHISEQVNEFNDEVFCHIGSGIDIIMAVNYIPGEEKALREIMQKYFEWYPDDYMYNTNEYDYSETGERIYTKDTILTFGE